MVAFWIFLLQVLAFGPSLTAPNLADLSFPSGPAPHSILMMVDIPATLLANSTSHLFAALPAASPFLEMVPSFLAESKAILPTRTNPTAILFQSPARPVASPILRSPSAAPPAPAHHARALDAAGGVKHTPTSVSGIYLAPPTPAPQILYTSSSVSGIYFARPTPAPQVLSPRPVPRPLPAFIGPRLPMSPLHYNETYESVDHLFICLPEHSPRVGRPMQFKQRPIFGSPSVNGRPLASRFVYPIDPALPSIFFDDRLEDRLEDLDEPEPEPFDMDSYFRTVLEPQRRPTLRPAHQQSWYHKVFGALFVVVFVASLYYGPPGDTDEGRIDMISVAVDFIAAQRDSFRVKADVFWNAAPVPPVYAAVFLILRGFNVNILIRGVLGCALRLGDRAISFICRICVVYIAILTHEWEETKFPIKNIIVCRFFESFSIPNPTSPQYGVWSRNALDESLRTLKDIVNAVPLANAFIVLKRTTMDIANVIALAHAIVLDMYDPLVLWITDLVLCVCTRLIDLSVNALIKVFTWTGAAYTCLCGIWRTMRRRTWFFVNHIASMCPSITLSLGKITVIDKASRSSAKKKRRAVKKKKAAKEPQDVDDKISEAETVHSIVKPVGTAPIRRVAGRRVGAPRPVRPVTAKTTAITQ
ncbi:hypothetical protein H0H87_012657 [Tephrocybe sp. NHM501043]|nr:hypothetical protein H0H87_012657 [Tephrocybe sp. NHM501043]